MYVTVYGTKQVTGEYNIVFRCISINNWFARGKENALKLGYGDFRFFTVPEMFGGR
jgi:hypothetical protein